MNSIEICKLEQFMRIIDDLLYLSGKQSEEIYNNMWCITLEGDLVESINLEQLESFINRLIENRKQQLKYIDFQKDAVFYMWFDQQALQLRFNILTGNEKKLPFGCRIQLINSYDSILNNFIRSTKNVAQYAEEIQFFDKDDTDWDDDEIEEDYQLEVFVKNLNEKL
jgi:hypothetical protein